MNRSIVISIALLLGAATAAVAAPAHPPRHHAHPGLHAAVTLDFATVIAKAQVPGGKVKSHELETEKGKLIYSFDFEVPGKSGIDEVNIDAMTGKVIAVEHESPKSERKEKQQEQREAAPKTNPTH